MRDLNAMLRLDVRGLREVAPAVPVIIGLFWLLNWNQEPTWLMTALMILIFLATQNVFRFGLFAGKVALLDVLPVRRRTVVVAHYLVILTVTVVSHLLGAVSFLALQGIGVVLPAHWGQRMLMALGATLLIIGLLVPHWWRPLRSWRTIVAHLPLIGVVVIAIILIAAHTTGTLGPQWSAFLSVHGPWLLVVIGLAAFAGCLPITLHVAERLDH